MKKITMLMSLALVLCLGLGAGAMAEVTTLPAIIDSPNIEDLQPITPEVDVLPEAKKDDTPGKKEAKGPLALDENADKAALLTASFSLAFDGDPDLTISFDVAAEKGENAGEIGKLRQLQIPAGEGLTIEDIRYTTALSDGGKTLTINLKFECTQDGKTQQLSDKLILTPSDSDASKLMIKAEKSGDPVPTNG